MATDGCTPIASAKSVVSRLGLDRSVESYVLADACDYTIPSDSIPDILLCETMSTALEREPQVAIMRHLLGQAPDAVIVPESVRVDAFLVDTSKEPDLIVPESENPSAKWQPDRIPVGPVFELNASMNPLSVGLPGREKSSVTSLAYAQRSRSREINSLP